MSSPAIVCKCIIKNYLTDDGLEMYVNESATGIVTYKFNDN